MSFPFCLTGETDGPLFLPYAAADISDVCRSFITSHSHPPLHIFGDLFGRLSKSALDGLAQKEELVNEVLQETCEKEKDWMRPGLGQGGGFRLL